jgi:hypothetical protein
MQETPRSSREKKFSIDEEDNPKISPTREPKINKERIMIKKNQGTCSQVFKTWRIKS